jgi:hypothetical protein
MTGPQKLTDHRQSAMVLSESGDRFDQELAGWFALHGGVWRGTAAELIAAVEIRAGVGNDFWPQSPRALYAQIESRRLQLRCLGVDITLHQGYPRMLSLRSCEQTARKPPLGTSGINRTINLQLADEQKVNLADAREIRAAATKSFSQNIPIAKSDLETSLNKSANPESMVLGFLASKLAAAPTLLWLTLKRVWTRRTRAM